jgi:glycerophosphoryl diester phosphodiesterase
MRAIGSAFIALAWGSFAAAAFDLQGHRGTRGYMPENTLPAFKKAIEIGVTTIETDLALTSDGYLVLSHNPVLNADLTRDEIGNWLKAPGPAIRSLTLKELQRYDVGRLKPGTRYAEDWPQQSAIDETRIPTLAALFAIGETATYRLRYNIETKLSPDKPSETPDPETFAAAVVQAIRALGLSERVTVQSFDWRTLVATKRLAPEIATVCLTIDTARTSTVRPRDGKPSPWLAGIDPAAHEGSIPKTVRSAGCSTWSPFWRNITVPLVAEAQGLGLKVIPWTVNDPADMANVIDMKIDGLITDYPDRARKALAGKGIEIAQ